MVKYGTNSWYRNAILLARMTPSSTIQSHGFPLRQSVDERLLPWLRGGLVTVRAHLGYSVPNIKPILSSLLCFDGSGSRGNIGCILTECTMDFRSVLDLPTCLIVALILFF